MEHNRFDDLTRALAGSTSRRQTLKVLAGGLLAALGAGSARAKGGNSECAKFCTSLFPPGAERGKCVSDAAKGKGVCYTCGPAAPANSTNYICGTTCISNSQPCNGVCPPNYQLCNDSCIPDDQCCVITPNVDSLYTLTCDSISLTCDSLGQTILSANCEDVFGDPIPTSIIVNTCSSSNYFINNCNGNLTCGNC